jgi:hypothetical protein
MRGWPSRRDSTYSRWSWRPSRRGTPPAGGSTRPPRGRLGTGWTRAREPPRRRRCCGPTRRSPSHARDAYSGRRPRSAPLLREDRAHRRRPHPDAPFRTFAIAPEPLAPPQFASRKNMARFRFDPDWRARLAAAFAWNHRPRPRHRRQACRLCIRPISSVGAPRSARCFFPSAGDRPAIALATEGLCGVGQIGAAGEDWGFARGRWRHDRDGR